VIEHLALCKQYSHAQTECYGTKSPLGLGVFLHSSCFSCMFTTLMIFVYVYTLSLMQDLLSYTWFWNLQTEKLTYTVCIANLTWQDSTILQKVSNQNYMLSLLYSWKFLYMDVIYTQITLIVLVTFIWLCTILQLVTVLFIDLLMSCPFCIAIVENSCNQSTSQCDTLIDLLINKLWCSIGSYKYLLQVAIDLRSHDIIISPYIIVHFFSSNLVASYLICCEALHDNSYYDGNNW